MPTQDPGVDFPQLRREINELLARNALAMVQNTIDAVNEGGQYQAMKFLFEMVGLFPLTMDAAPAEDGGLAGILLDSLGIGPGTPDVAEKPTGSNTVESE